MAKDNLAKAAGPEAKTQEVKAKGPRTKKQRLIERLTAAGVKDAGKMTEKQLRTELHRIKAEGIQVPDLRQGNSAPVSLSKDPYFQQEKRDHLLEEVDYPMKVGGQTKIVKMKTFKALLTRLRNKALYSNDTREMVTAMHEYFDRTMGKAKQEIEVEGEIKTEEQRPSSKAEKAAAKAYLDNLDDEDL